MINLQITYSGTKGWFTNNTIHRLVGPAVERSTGYRAWYKYDKYHRLDGPAVEYSWGEKEWHINGIEYDSYLEYLVAVDEYNLGVTTHDS